MKTKSFAVIVATCTILCHWDAFGCSEGIFMKEIHLGGKYGSIIGNYALVDDADYDWLNQWKWTAHKKVRSKTLYVERTDHSYDTKKTVLMHRLILGLTDPGVFCDHADTNGLNNQRDNIRVCTQQQNMMNRASFSGTSSQFKGVCFLKRDKKWAANIRVNTILKHLGYFANETDAALAYNAAATKYHGEFARLNIITND